MDDVEHTVAETVQYFHLLASCRKATSVRVSCGQSILNYSMAYPQQIVRPIVGNLLKKELLMDITQVYLFSKTNFLFFVKRGYKMTERK